MVSKRYADAPIRVLDGTIACPLEDRLSHAEAVRQIGLQRSSPNICSVIASLALHDGEVPLTQNDLSRETGYTQAHISRAVLFLYRIGMVERGGIKRVGVGGRVVDTIVPGEDFSERVSEVPIWQDAVDRERNERKIEVIAGELGTSSIGALTAIISYYEENRPTTLDISGQLMPPTDSI